MGKNADNRKHQMARLATLEANTKAAVEKAKTAEQHRAIDEVLNNFRWANRDCRELARNYFAQHIHTDADGEQLLGDLPLEGQMTYAITNRFANLLEPTAKGAPKGSNKTAAISYDSLTAQTPKAQLDAAARQLAAELALLEN